LDDLFFEKKYESKYGLIKSNRDKDAIFFNGLAIIIIINVTTKILESSNVDKKWKKERTGKFTLMNDDSYKSHQCGQLMPIQFYIMIINSEIEAEILKRPTLSINKLYDEKS